MSKKQNSHPIIAIMYDFDKTLCTDYMQNYKFIPSLGMQKKEFWDRTNQICKEENMDSTLAYMYAMVLESESRNIPITKKKLFETGKGISFFQGLSSWFNRMNKFGEQNNVKVEHYIISSGLKEIIEGTELADNFTKIFACEFVYGEDEKAVWPKTCVNYTNKTQFIYRINKGVLEVSNDDDLNRSMPDDSKRVPFCNMIYIGDGLSDVPCMKMMKSYGGKSIAVYEHGTKSRVEELLVKDRVDFIFPTDYTENSGIEITVKNIIKEMAIKDILTSENYIQKQNIKKL